jgi:hypothetical protein
MFSARGVALNITTASVQLYMLQNSVYILRGQSYQQRTVPFCMCLIKAEKSSTPHLFPTTLLKVTFFKLCVITAKLHEIMVSAVVDMKTESTWL